MSKFKVGDTVIGNKEASSRYGITVEGWVGTVKQVDNSDNTILVEGNGTSGCWVDPSYFDPYWGGLCARVNGKFIQQVIFNDPATIIIWNDNTKTVVKCGKDEKYDPEKGLALCIAKMALGNKYEYYEPFKRYLGRYYKNTQKKGKPAKKNASEES